MAEPGQTIAIVGPTGAGKTTLVNLLMRFYDLDARHASASTAATSPRCPGASCAPRSAWCCRTRGCSAAPSATTSRYGNPDATDEQIREAARVTYVDRFVHSLPDGYDTVINDEGDNISAGEKQLITIARAFLADPSILILDEATSSVDTRTEVLIQEAMNALRADRTSFVIAHRLVDHPRRRRDPRDGRRPDRRAGQPRRAAAPRRPLLEAVPRPVRRPGHLSVHERGGQAKAGVGVWRVHTIGVPVRRTVRRSHTSIVPMVTIAVAGPSTDFTSTNVVVDAVSSSHT